ncbi:MAG: hypothetical protein B7Z55_19895, partial [Planctomycetales bacterium 12-60-4]
QCKNHLKQIGLALNNYHGSHSTFPPGRMRSLVDGAGRCFSAYAHLLPYVDASALYNQINFNADPDDPVANGVALGQTIPYFLCPSDSYRILQSNVVAGVIVDSAVHNYPLCTGTTYPLSPRNPSGVAVTGVFFENSRVRFADVSDGSSQTVCISETIKAEGGPSTWDGVSATNGFVLTQGNNNSTRLRHAMPRRRFTASADARQPVVVRCSWTLDVQSHPRPERPRHRLPRRFAAQHSYELLVGSAIAERGGKKSPYRGSPRVVCGRPCPVCQRECRPARLAGPGEPRSRRSRWRVLTRKMGTFARLPWL